MLPAALTFLGLISHFGHLCSHLRERVLVFRPLYAVGGQTLGFLPGDTGEKMQPWAEAVFDTLSSVVARERIDRVLQLGQLEAL